MMTTWERRRDHLCAFPCLSKDYHLQSEQDCLGAGNIASATSQYLFLRKDERFTANWSHFILHESRGSHATVMISWRTTLHTTHFSCCLLSPAPGLLEGSKNECTKLWPLDKGDEEGSSWSFRMEGLSKEKLKPKGLNFKNLRRAGDTGQQDSACLACARP